MCQTCGCSPCSKCGGAVKDGVCSGCGKKTNKCTCKSCKSC